MSLNDPQWRKERPLFSGLLRYFPLALLEVAHCSYVGNRQHNGDAPLHWDRAKSTDEADALVRHLMQAGTDDTDGIPHSAKVAWRALALLQKELEARNGVTVTQNEVTRPTYDDVRAEASPCLCGRLYTHPGYCERNGVCGALEHPHATP